MVELFHHALSSMLGQARTAGWAYMVHDLAGMCTSLRPFLFFPSSLSTSSTVCRVHLLSFEAYIANVQVIVISTVWSVCAFCCARWAVATAFCAYMLFFCSIFLFFDVIPGSIDW